MINTPKKLLENLVAKYGVGTSPNEVSRKIIENRFLIDNKGFRKIELYILENNKWKLLYVYDASEKFLYAYVDDDAPYFREIVETTGVEETYVSLKSIFEFFKSFQTKWKILDMKPLKSLSQYSFF